MLEDAQAFVDGTESKSPRRSILLFYIGKEEMHLYINPSRCFQMFDLGFDGAAFWMTERDALCDLPSRFITKVIALYCTMLPAGILKAVDDATKVVSVSPNCYKIRKGCGKESHRITAHTLTFD